MLYFIIKGGVMMIPIILASIVGAGIIAERFFVIRRVYRLNMAEFSGQVLGLVEKSRYKEALDACSQKKEYPLAAMYAAAIENRLLSRLELEKVLERMGNHYVKILEKRLGGLVSIVGISPLMGFLGTITGLIRAFMAWEKAGNEVTVSALASGIYEAMITTAAGLIVAIPYYLCYNYFISRIKYFSHELDDYSSQLLELLTRGRVL
ncbi:MAG: MotA/TolQ/ExbB proton channel family protein [Candidatus Omnitrophica bacterium]|nr:MotA/TolQ/ExbB proton channel family protein [Candidatus Omnitrophota bacterium]MDD5574877.1 MotA/TolQ/ExbB proton channel family protein [Candidatus Omnitrophota bacterium]